MHETINGLVASYGYALLVVLVGLESFGIPLPGETALVTAGAFAAMGRLNIAGVIIAASAGAILGDNAGYWLGRKGGVALVHRYGRHVGLDDAKLERVHGFFERHGPKTVFIGRFIALLRSWAAALAEYAGSEVVSEQAEYWLEQAEAAVMRLAADGGGENRMASVAGVVEELSEAYTSKLLKQAPEVYHTQINDLLLAALALALQQWRGAEGGETVRVKVNLEGHGRHQELGDELGEGLDLSRTVGWFTALYPVVLEVRAGETLDAHVKRVKEQLRGVPEQGLGYGLLRYLRDDEVSRRLEAAGEAQLSFNYLGQTDQVLEPQRQQLGLRAAAEGTGPSAAAASRRAHLIDINAVVSGGRLRVTRRSHLSR